MSTKFIAEKIAKCLALAESANPHEAEAARRQAKKLMEKYSIDPIDIDLAKVAVFNASVPGKSRPALHLSQLASLVCTAFDCKAITQSGSHAGPAKVIFIGLGCKPELAGYTFDVLRRQITRDRTAYAATLSRLKPKNKTKRLEDFCHGWLYRINSQIQDFSCNARETELAEAYIQKTYGDNLKEDTRAEKSSKGKASADAVQRGYRTAEQASLHRPVQTQPKAALEDQRQTSLF